MLSEKEIRNRARCNSCAYNHCCTCNVMLGCDTKDLDMCILDILKDKPMDSPEMFMLRTQPVVLMSWLSFNRKNRVPKKGTKVITLRAGFGGYGGNIRFVDSITNTTIELIDTKGNKYISRKDKWFEDFFALDKYN